MSSAPHALNGRTRDQFRQVQALAYDCAEAIAAELEPGISEREAAAMMKSWLLERGVDDWFHQPFAWFGERTAFQGFSGLLHFRGFNPAFFPSRKKLSESMPFILDCAPSRRGITADIGYCGALGENRILDRLMDDLLEYRVLILEQIRAGQPLAEVSRAVDQLCTQHGYEPRHKAYPFQVLAHRVELLEDDGRDSHLSLLRFGVRNVSELLGNSIKGLREGWSPLWSSDERSQHPATPGLWAVEPHLGFRGVGAKFEELLVVTESDVYWLDDDVPHVRRWQQRGLLCAEAA